eukprot:CAMPEP_0114554550 /NCGR_PEP_ID=MMETSP0114-20121206/8269_1 /TAXON_ID=31324 /ORGANISM="Goniomonas sp, Strain m" /LENGTH=112 /DNA_ID=CAMNT_0001739603 /DNA_START=403 /DNA_END=737 /DNA_ORIENTATION=-
MHWPVRAPHCGGARGYSESGLGVPSGVPLGVLPVRRQTCGTPNACALSGHPAKLSNRAHSRDTRTTEVRHSPCVHTLRRSAACTERTGESVQAGLQRAEQRPARWLLQGRAT